VPRQRRQRRQRSGAERKEFLQATADDQIRALIAGGISGTDMSPWSVAFGGTLTDEQIGQVTTYLRSLKANAPSVPDWRKGGG
jgi:mono/diheme cytochrome c family protein